MNNDYMYGFVSNNELSAGLWSNSEHDGSSVATSVTGGSKNTRVQAVTQKNRIMYLWDWAAAHGIIIVW